MTNFQFDDIAKAVTMTNRVGALVTIPYAKAGIEISHESHTRYSKGLMYLDYKITCGTCSDIAEDDNIPAVDCNCGAFRPEGEISWRVDY